MSKRRASMTPRSSIVSPPHRRDNKTVPVVQTTTVNPFAVLEVWESDDEKDTQEEPVRDTNQEKQSEKKEEKTMTPTNENGETTGKEETEQQEEKSTHQPSPEQPETPATVRSEAKKHEYHPDTSSGEEHNREPEEELKRNEQQSADNSQAETL
jgi:hypothetical protein